MATVSFTKDIVPMFYDFRGPMLWRFDLTKYEDVKANASAIYSMISVEPSQGGMPPEPFPAFTAVQVKTFQQWMTENFPP
ncbi:MAG TPA: hypothetical protein VI636_12685 [Candidatus Angelobacter sp.]